MALQHQTTQRNPTEEHLGYACALKMQIAILLQVYTHQNQHAHPFNRILQDPQMLDQLAKNITRCGLSNSTLNYLRVSRMTFIVELISPEPEMNKPCLFIFPKAMCDFGAHAGADVQT